VFLEARGDATELLEFAEEPLDQVAAAVDVRRNASLEADATLGWDMRLTTARRHPFDQSNAVIAAIRDHGARRQGVQEDGRSGLVRRLPGREVEPDGQPVLIHDGMDLGAQPATRTANGVILAPFFPPAACWWARTMELSINCRDCGDRSASSSNTFSQIPRFAQRLNRL
jgi:hypothetical protein